MPEPLFSDELTRISQSRSVTSEDVLTLRRHVFGDGVIDQTEAETLFTLDANLDNRCDDWVDFLSEAMVDYLVNQVAPEGYISEENGQWLISCILRDGEVNSVTELEILIKVLEKAKSAPDALGRLCSWPSENGRH